MIPDERLEPYQDERGALWQFYKGRAGDFEYAYTLQLPQEIHNYVLDHYIGTDEQGPLPADFRFTPPMIEDVAHQWEAQEGERPSDLTAFRAAVEETVNHRYYRQDRAEIDLDDLAQRREQIVYDPLPEQPEQEAYDDFSFLDESSDVAYQLVDAGELEQDPQPPSEDFVTQDLLEQAPFNFRDTADAQMRQSL